MAVLISLRRTTTAWRHDHAEVVTEVKKVRALLPNTETGS